MLVQYGMDEDLGLAVYKEDQDYTLFKPYSEEKAEQIDKKIKEYLDKAYKKAKEIIQDHKDEIVRIAGILIRKEYLSGDDFSEMIDHPETIDAFEEAIEKKEKEEEKNHKKKKNLNLHLQNQKKQSNLIYLH